MKSIWGKLAFKISVGLTIVLAAIGAFDVYIQYQQDNAALQAKKARILEQLALILGAPLYQLDQAQIEKILSIYLLDPEILAIHVSENERVVKHLGKAAADSPELLDLTERQVEYASAAERISRNILYEDAPLGTITVVFSRHAILAHISHTVVFVAGTLALAIGIVSLMVLLLIKKHVTRHLLSLVQIARKIAAGNVNISLSKHNNADEIGQLQQAMSTMIDYIKEVAAVAEHVANQQLHVQITPRSEYDLLNTSLLKMVNDLRNMLAQNARTLREIEQQNWLNDGLNQLNTKLVEHLSLEETCRRAVSFVTRYVNAGWGVLYVYDADRHVLTLGGSFAFTENDQLAHTYRLGEGVPGQAALERAPILLSNIQGQNYRINTGMISEKPLTTYTMPLLYNNELYGVLELASFETLTESQQHFLHEANQALAMVIFSASQRDRFQKLLHTSEQARQEAETAKQAAQEQREEAQKANAQLEEQQQRLQQQSEEMQQINAHLEEQQQQLQQQSEEFRQQNEQLQIAKEDMTRRAHRLENIHQDRLENFSNMYHELQQPLQTIILRSQEVQTRNRESLSFEDRRQLNLIRWAGQELQYVLANRLELRKIESGNLTIETSRCSTRDLLNACQRQFEIEAEEKGIEFLLQDRLQAILHIDQQKLLHIVQNLLALTFHFTQNGSITCRASQHPSQAELIQFAVIITGNTASRRKYRRLLSSHEELDISISKDFDLFQVEGAVASTYTKLLEGKLEVSGKSDNDIHIVLTLPTTLEWLEESEEPDVQNVFQSPEKGKERSSRMKEDIEEFHSSRPQKGPIASDSRVNRLNNRKILIADDDIKNVFILASALENHGAAVIDAQNGKMALEILHQDEAIDLVLLDIMMPMMDGYTTLREIRKDEHFADLPIIVLTARTSQDERQKCLEAGANDYLSKPVDYDDLIRVIQTWLEEK